ncbi:MAG: hypothetical protein ACYDAL_16540, partial [Candidatus Dormibacteraceae bacterium]
PVRGLSGGAADRVRAKSRSRPDQPPLASLPGAKRGLKQQALCHRHHRMVHEGGWQIVRGDDRHMLTIPPIVTFGPCSRGPD